MLAIRRAHETKRCEELSLEGALDLLRSGDVPLWLELDSPSQTELDFLETNLKIHHLTLEDIVKQNQRPKIEAFEDYIYLAIHPLVRKNDLEIEPAEVDLLLGPNWLVMVHYGPIPGLLENGRWDERLDAALHRGADFLLYTIVDLIVDSCFPILDAIDDEIDTLEDRVLGQTDLEDMDRLLALKRSLVRIRRAVGPQREVFNQLSRRDFPFVQPDTTVYFRDVYDHLIRITEELDSLRDLLSGALEVHLTSVSNQLNVIMKRLSAWATIFVVITAIAGIYGMNFDYMPELKWRYGYAAVIALMTAVSVGLFVYFKRKDYF
jgi:magnesium transporter